MTNEEKDRIINALEHVCDEKRDSLARPFIRGEYLYALNGLVAFRYRIAAELPRFAEYEAQENAPSQESMERIFNIDKAKVSWFDSRASMFIVQAMRQCLRRHEETWEEELNRIEHYTCPCCDNTVYLNGNELVDADEATDLLTRYGIEIVQDGEKTSFSGDKVYDAVNCLCRLSIPCIDRIGINADGNLVLSVARGVEGLMSCSGEPLFPGDEPKTEIVGTFELKKENE